MNSLAIPLRAHFVFIQFENKVDRLESTWTIEKHQWLTDKEETRFQNLKTLIIIYWPLKVLTLTKFFAVFVLFFEVLFLLLKWIRLRMRNRNVLSRSSSKETSDRESRPFSIRLIIYNYFLSKSKMMLTTT